MHPLIITINSGSSNLKFGVFEHHSKNRFPKQILKGLVQKNKEFLTLSVIDQDQKFSLTPSRDYRLNNNNHLTFPTRVCLDWITEQLPNAQIAAIGHRVVHGGEAHAAPAAVTKSLVTELEALAQFAPLHQPANVAGIEECLRRYPRALHVACFDTSFHLTQNLEARSFGLPRALYDAGIRRFGFHGLSYQYIAQTLSETMRNTKQPRVVAAHLGGGASICGLYDWKSVMSSMGLTPLDGLVMSTRSGSLDPGAILCLLRRTDMSIDKLENILYRESGLLGLSGISGDIRDLLNSNKSQANQAIDIFIHSIVREVGATVASLGGIDALVFSGGIGEHSHPIRSRVCEKLAWLGIEIDASANEAGLNQISSSRSTVSVRIVHTDEEQIIARAAAELVNSR